MKGESLRGVVVNMPGCNIVICKFELQFHYYV